ncbi:Tropomodulin-2, partial [Eschrichtius robustus]|nr:Tropomodulin-2 [Eschrichtius robustus]
MALPFQKDLEKYKNIDEDELLGKLSEDELKQLENVLDDLDPEWIIDTGIIPEIKESQLDVQWSNASALSGQSCTFSEKPIETRKEEKVTLDPELEEALASASDTELYDLAAVLGVHNLLNNPKFDEETASTKGGKGPVRSFEGGFCQFTKDHWALSSQTRID